MVNGNRVAALALGFLFCLGAVFAEDVKRPNVAGTFYPATPGILLEMLDGFLKEANPAPLDKPIFALIVPHAGYGYSGRTAALAFKLVRDKPYRTVIVIGTAHQHGFSGASVYPQGKFRTPLGDLEVDQDFSAQLLGKDKYVSFVPQAFEQEHSLEVELPFLQRTLADFKIVPIVTGDCTLETCQKLAALLKAAIGLRTDVLVVVSSDMYHGYDFDEANSFDARTISYITKMDGEGLYYGLREGKLQMCGGFGVVTALLLAKEMGHNTVKVLGHTNSCEVTGKIVKGVWTVGYASAVIYNPGERSTQPQGENNMLNKAQRKKLLELARNSITTYLATGKKLEVKESDETLLKPMGAFVTLSEHGELRGCIGNMVGAQPLYLTIRDMAVEAAVGDPRFPPVVAPEVKSLEIEISVLSPMERIDSVDKIVLGKHGVLVRKGFRSGVYLPQVATETGWSKEEFLSSLCAHKAGLPAEAWKDKSTEIYIYTAEVFSEKIY